MKKIIFIALIFAISSPLHALSLKKQVAKLEEKVDTLARNEHRAWKEIARLNLEIDRLEKEASRTKKT